MANIIASGTSASDSSEFTLVDGQSCTLALTGSPDANAAAQIFLKNADASFTYVGQLTAAERTKVLQAVGTFKVSRLAAAVAFGVDKN